MAGRARVPCVPWFHSGAAGWGDGCAAVCERLPWLRSSAQHGARGWHHLAYSALSSWPQPQSARGGDLHGVQERNDTPLSPQRSRREDPREGGGVLSLDPARMLRSG